MAETPFTGTVTRTWQGQGGAWFATVHVERANSYPTVSRREPFREGERVRLDRAHGLFSLAVG
jgi:hypothetical protein